MTDIGKRIAASRKDKGLSQYALARLLGVNQSTVAYYERGRNTPKPWVIEDMARILNVSASYLLYGREDVDPPVPIVGRVAADGAIHLTPDAPLGQVALPPGASSRSLALRIEGHSLWPVYRDGDVVFFTDEDPHKAPEAVVGRDCLVETAEDGPMIALVKRGRTKAVFTLSFFRAPDLEDRDLTRAAPIRWVCRAP